MHLKHFLLFCLTLAAIPLIVDGFSMFGWMKHAFSSDNSKKIHTIEGNATKLNITGSVKAAHDKKVNNIKRSSNDYSDLEAWEANQIPATCDEDAILLPLARLRIISPEKIIELLASSSLEYTCERVNSTINDVKNAIDACENFPKNHLYKKLCDGLEYFAETICVDVSDDYKRKKEKKGLLQHWECYNQLQDDLYDCEGPPDWFEKKNKSAACQFYSDITDCNYVKAAMLCGKEAAKLLREFSDAVMRSVLLFRCKISRSDPHVDSALVARAFHIQIYEAYVILVFSTLLIWVL